MACAISNSKSLAKPLLGGVWQGTLHGPCTRGNPKGSQRGHRRLGRGAGVGSETLSAGFVPQPDRRRASAGLPCGSRNPQLPGNACLLLPSNDAPCCIATRIRVPSGLSRRATSDPSPVVLARPRSSALAPPALAAPSPARPAPEPGSRLALTASGRCCPSRATSLKRATKPAPQSPGVGLPSAHAQGRLRPGAHGSLPASTWRALRMRSTLSIFVFPEISHRERVGSEARAGNGSLWRERGKT